MFSSSRFHRNMNPYPHTGIHHPTLQQNKVPQSFQQTIVNGPSTSSVNPPQREQPESWEQQIPATLPQSTGLQAENSDNHHHTPSWHSDYVIGSLNS